MTSLSNRIGIQTISWGPWLEDVQRLLIETANCGYRGVEFAQPITGLPNPDKLEAILQSTSQRFLGLAGGSLRSRIDYARACRPDYLYMDELDEDGFARAKDAGLKIALHPHVFKELHSTAAIEPLLDQYPDQYLILDTAHSYLAGENPMEIAQKHWERMVVVHLKDWTGHYGRTATRFARGFTSLGNGELGDMIKKLVEYLLIRDYPGWIVVEQDTPEGDPFLCATKSREWLRKIGV